MSGFDGKVAKQSFQGAHKSHMRTRKGLATALSKTLAVSTFTKATHFPNGYIPEGMALGKITSGGDTGKYGRYDDAATDGRQVMVGLTLDRIDVINPNTGGDISTGFTVVAVQTEGDIITANLPTNNGVDAAGKVDVGTRFTWE